MRGTAGRSPTHSASRQRRRHSFTWIGLAVAVVVVVLMLNVERRNPEPPAFEATPFTSDPGLELEPRLSPDGGKVAYVWNGQAADNFDVYVKPVAGGSPRRLTTDRAR